MWSEKRAYEPNRMFQIASCAHCDAQIDGRSTTSTSGNFGFVGRWFFRDWRANTWKRWPAWFWTVWNQVLQPDLSDLRPDCQDPGFACSSASRYRTFEITILSTIWLLGTSSHELWSILNQTALGYLAYQASTRFQNFGGRGPDLVSSIEKMVRMDLFCQNSMSKA